MIKTLFNSKDFLFTINEQKNQYKIFNSLTGRFATIPKAMVTQATTNDNIISFLTMVDVLVNCNDKGIIDVCNRVINIMGITNYSYACLFKVLIMRKRLNTPFETGLYASDILELI